MTKSAEIPLVRLRLSEDDIESTIKSLKSGRLVCGPSVEKFEQMLADFLGSRYSVCVSSGTAALHLGLLGLGIRPGDDVIVPAFSYPASANAVELIGARPVFIDSEKNGFNIDTARIENYITARTRAIMVVHNFGWPVDIKKVQALSAKYDIPIIEDAACALGSSIDGVKCGNLGRLATFSFHPRKILTTGEGGTVVTDSFELAERIKSLRNHGQSFEDGVEFYMPGFNYRMTEFQAALGISQMNRFASVIEQRRSAAAYYNEKLAGTGFLKLQTPSDNMNTNFQTYTAFVEEGLRDPLIEHLKAGRIEAGIGTYSIPHTKYYARKYQLDSSEFPESYKAFKNIISLPLYEGISGEEQDRVIGAIKKFNYEKKTSSAACAAVHKR